MPMVKTPHEFLVRWDDAGKLQGAHIAYREAFVDDAGVEQISKFGDPLAVLLNDSALLATISASINTAALADAADKGLQVSALTFEKDQALAAQAQAEAERDAALRDKAALAERMAALQASISAQAP